jgi:hypothetical protein
MKKKPIYDMDRYNPYWKVYIKGLNGPVRIIKPAVKQPAVDNKSVHSP